MVQASLFFLYWRISRKRKYNFWQKAFFKKIQTDSTKWANVWFLWCRYLVPMYLVWPIFWKNICLRNDGYYRSQYPTIIFQMMTYVTLVCFKSIEMLIFVRKEYFLAIFIKKSFFVRAIKVFNCNFFVEITKKSEKWLYQIKVGV